MDRATRERRVSGRVFPILATMGLLAAMLGIVATPASAGTPRCGGLPATIVGTSGDDTIQGTTDDDVILGLDGADVISGLGGNDLICGSSGNDLIHGGPGSDGLYGGGGNDVLRCGGGHDGGLSGGPGDDALYGERDGRTDYEPGTGDDLVVGSGTGEDWVHYETATGPIHANLTTGIATGQGTDTLVAVSGLFMGQYDDILTGDDGTNQLAGGPGDDTLIGHGGDDTLSGEQDDDIIRGGKGFDVAENYDQAAAGGREIGPMNINLRTGIATGDGTDSLSGIEGATGSDKADTMIGNGKSNLFTWMFLGNDTVKAGGGSDYVESSAGANVLSGGAGRDLLFYLDGKDFDHQHHAVTVDLGTGTSSSGDTLSGFEDVFGSPNDDILIGGSGRSRLFGWLGDDVLKGRAGNDRLDGMDGSDRAYGGKGDDRCHAEVRRNCEPARKMRLRSPLTHFLRGLLVSRAALKGG